MLNSRREKRILIVQTLFESDFHNKKFEFNHLMETFRKIGESNNVSPIDESAFVKEIFEKLEENSTLIDEIIETVSSSNWPLHKMGIVDRNILRLATCELLCGKDFDVPPRVALNEAIEITKRFLNDTSRKFVSGVLGNIYIYLKESSEDGSYDAEDDNNRRIKHQKSIGALVYRVTEKHTLQFVLVHDIFNKWTLSKGKLLKEEENDVSVGLMRVIKSELGIKGEIIGEVGLNSYIAHIPDQPVRKEVRYFLVKTDDVELNPEEKEGIKEVRWFNEKEILNLSLYTDLIKIIEKGVVKAREFENIS